MSSDTCAAAITYIDGGGAVLWSRACELPAGHKHAHSSGESTWTRTPGEQP